MDQGALVLPEPHLEALAARGEPVPLAYPGDLPELLRWEEPFRAISFAPTGDNLVWELWRVDVGKQAVFVLERLSTYLRVSTEAGVFFLTDANTDPLAAVVGPGGEVLQVAWTLVVVANDSAPSRFLFGDPPQLIPTGSPAPGLPRTWRDFRYSHGSRYTEHKQIVIPGPAQLRLFVQVRQVAGDPVSLFAGSLASGYQIAAGTASRAAIRASITRS